MGLDAPAVRAGLPGPGLALRYGDAPGYAGLDRFDQVTDMTWTFGNGDTLERFRYAYDRGGRRTRREQPLAPAFSETYEYDAFGQLTRMTRDGGGGWQNWTLEHVGNWSAFAGPSGTQTRQHNAANELTALDGNSGVVAHDAAGNMTRLPSDLTGERRNRDTRSVVIPCRPSERCAFGDGVGGVHRGDSATMGSTRMPVQMCAAADGAVAV